MNTTVISSTRQNIIPQFFPVFTVPRAEIFLNVVSGWVLCTAKHTVTGILPFADPEATRAHDAYHHFFADALGCLRRVLWQDRIKCMFGKRLVHDKNFEFLIEALASAA